MMGLEKPSVHTIAGPPALSEFRGQVLALRVGAKHVEGQYLHYVDLKRDLDDNEKILLGRLLTGANSELVDNDDKLDTQTFYVDSPSGHNLTMEL